MSPLDSLLAGAAILDPVLAPHGFRFAAPETGHGSGGAFARGAYVRGDRRLELHVRHALGVVTYGAGDATLDHEPYLDALGVARDARRYPGFSNEPLDGFRHLAHDVATYCDEFLAGDAAVLRAAAPVVAARRAAAWREMEARYEGDDALRAEARRLVRAGEYARAVAAFETLRYPDLLSDSERAALRVARRRATGG